MNVNYLTENFRQEIYDTVNNCQLPISTVYFVFKDVFSDIVKAYESAVKREYQLQQQQNIAEESVDFDIKE